MLPVRIILTAIAGAAVGFLLWTLAGGVGDEHKPVVISHGEADIGGPFELVDTKGGTVTDRTLLGKHALVYFGYTSCPDVCPLDMNRISMALGTLEQEFILVDKIRPVFISVDPARDTPDVIAAFLDQYHPLFLGLTGTEDQMQQAADAYKVYVEGILASEHGGHDPGLINHSSYIYLMGPDGRYVTHFGSDMPPSRLAEALAGHLD